MILDYRGAPYLRFSPEGVEVNHNSSMYYLNETPVAQTPPANLSPTAPPSWHRVTGGHAYEWHDGRLHALAAVALTPGVSFVGRWRIPLRVDGQLDSISGGLWHADNPTIVWFWAIVVLVACVLAAWRVRRPALDQLVARVLAVTALVAVTIAGARSAAARPPDDLGLPVRRARADPRVRRVGVLAQRCSASGVLHVLPDRGRGAVGGWRDDHDAAVRVRVDFVTGVPRARGDDRVPGHRRGLLLSCSACPTTATPASSRPVVVVAMRLGRTGSAALAALLLAGGVWIHRPASGRRDDGCLDSAARARGAGASDRARRRGFSRRRPARWSARACRSSVARVGVHVEVFAANRVVLVPAGIGTRPPRSFSAGRISSARCYGELVTLDPTGLVLVRTGSRPLLADLFRAWGQPLSARRLASFSASKGARVAVFVDGRRWRGSPGSVPLAPHAEIVLEVGPYVPPHRSYTFPPGS